MVITSSHISGIGVATPALTKQTELWEGFFRKHYSDNPLARRLFTTSGVTTRHGVVDPLVEDATRWTTQQRMQRYLPEALELGNTATSNALRASGMDASDVGMLVVTSCTGYVTPGVDVFMARDIGLKPETQRVLIGHMGCHAALPSLQVASDFARVHNKAALLLSVELPSLHVQPPTSDVEQMVAHALFSDAAAAAVIQPGAGNSAAFTKSVEIVDAMSVTNADEAERMRWDVTDLGFRMRLSQAVPDILKQHVRGLIRDLLSKHDLTLSDISNWAVHPGGPRILDVVQSELELETDALEASRRVLAEHGNCSSSTVLLVLEEILNSVNLAGGYIVALAFGPGLTLYAMLLHTRA